MLDMDILRNRKDDFLFEHKSYISKDIQKHIPNYEYLLYDLSRYQDEEIKGKAINQIAMTIMRDIFTTYPEGSEVVMTLAEKLRQEGMEKGIEKGEKKPWLKLR